MISLRLWAFAFVLAFASFDVLAADDYRLGPDSMPQEGVPKGRVQKLSWNKSAVYPGTTRDYWVYVPAQYNEAEETCLMVFQDGGGYINEKGSYRVPIVFDNLIHKKEMPVTIGIFVNPGVIPPTSKEALPRYNRSLEYDGLGDQYARFLINELIPEVAKSYHLKKDANSHAIAGGSSGAIAAFTAAWERPDAFSRVFSTIGTYVELRGGHVYPGLIRKTEPKPLRVFLQDGSNDQNIYGGNWWLANQLMASALEFAGYDFKTVWGDGGHNGKQGGSIFPEAMRWLWRDYPAPIKGVGKSRQPLMEILIPGEEWQLVGEGYGFTEGPAADPEGNVYFTDIPKNQIHKIDPTGKVSLFKENTAGANGLMFGPDGKLYACKNGTHQIVAYDTKGQEEVAAEGIDSNDLAVNARGEIYVTDPGHKQVWFINAKREKRVVDTGLGFPNGVRFTPDQNWLIVADTRGQFTYSFSVLPDGSLTNKSAYFDLQMPDGKPDSGADGMTVDSKGWLYITSSLGIQIMDQAGRVNGIINKPQPKWLANVAFGGSNHDYLYATCSDKVYRRKTKAKGVLSYQKPFTPPGPRL